MVINYKKSITKTQKKETPEEKLQKACVAYVRKNYKSTICFHPNNNVKPTGIGALHKKTASIIGKNNKDMGVLAGIPDLIILSSRLDNGKVYGSLDIELKSLTGIVSDKQKKIHSKLGMDNQCVKVIYNLPAFKEAVDTYLNLPKPN